jgi:hypothetical protein
MTDTQACKIAVVSARIVESAVATRLIETGRTGRGCNQDSQRYPPPGSARAIAPERCTRSAAPRLRKF